MNEIKVLREAKNSLNECVKATLKAVHISLKKLQFEPITFIEISFETTHQINFDVDFFDKFK